MTKAIKFTPQQEEFLKNYLDPQSETFGSARASAMKAGFTEDYAETILNRDLKWLNEALEEAQIVSQAMKNLSEFVSNNSDDPVDKKIKFDATKFSLERLNKKFKDKKSVEVEGNLTATIVINKPNGDPVQSES